MNLRLPAPKQEAPLSNLLTGQGVTETPPPVCTRVCTSEAENRNGRSLGGDQGEDAPRAPAPFAPTAERAADNPHRGSEGTDPAEVGREPLATGEPAAGASTDQGDPLANLAAALLALSPADRERLAAMLTGHLDKN